MSNFLVQVANRGLASLLVPAFTCLPPSVAFATQDQAPLERVGPLVLEARHVEHLYSRAGFGASRSEIEAGLALGLEALVDRLLEVRDDGDPFFHERFRIEDLAEMKDMEREERQKRINELRREDARQMREFGAWWIDRMIDGVDPLQDRMTLFWHGFFTSSYTDVKRSDELIAQNTLFREGSMGSYADLLHGVVRDSAMLRYLDNDRNRKQAPNENLARELLELFSLGEGNYTEADVKEAARALTGRRVGRDGDYELRGRDHDRGKKSILGEEGRLGGDDLVDILLRQEACSRWVARRLLSYFEGAEPSTARLESYARTLAEGSYELKPFLRRMFLDPEFYRDEAMGARVSSPIDYLVGICRRLSIEPPAFFIEEAAALLGQRLFEPPSVKGWDEGEAWITTSTMLQRGNLAGMLLGVVSLEDVLADVRRDIEQKPNDAPERMDEGEGMTAGPSPPMGDDVAEAARRRAMPQPEIARNLQALRRFGGPDGWKPRINLLARCERHGATTDVEIVDFLLDELLIGHARESTRNLLVEFLGRERSALGVENGNLDLAGAPAERLLRRLAHLVLCLPEAQLG